MSPAVETTLGFTEEELLGDASIWQELVHPDDLERILATLGQLEEGQPAWVEGRLRGRDDEGYRWFDVNAAVTALDGRGRRVTGVLRDVSERKHAEQRLQQAQKMEAVGNLTGGIAHDFNNLLGVVLGNLQLIQRRAAGCGADEVIGGRLATAIDAVNRGSDLTRRLLAFSRRQMLEPRVVDLNELVAGMERLLGRTLGETITVRMAGAQDLWPVAVDPGQAETALLNLAVNARDAMPDGGHLTIETANVTLDERYVERHSYAAPGDYVALAVSDTGTGMPSEVAEQAFEPFFTTKAPGRGTGLGLSMVYGFVKQSDGLVHIYSEQGEGTTVKMYFPRVAIDAEPLDSGGDEVPQDEGGHEPVLVVEDDPDLRDTVSEYLRSLGYVVTEAGTGGEALNALAAADPPVELLFTDLVIPGGMNGAELAAGGIL